MDLQTFLLLAVVMMGVGPSGTLAWPGNLYTNKNTPSRDRYNYFDADLLEVLSQGEKGNLLMSPLSIKIVLNMIMEGAAGRSAEEIRGALRLSNDWRAVRNEQKLNSIALETQSGVLKVASRAFVSSRYRISQAYAHSLKQNYGSDITEVRFDHPKEVSRIVNDWIANETSGLIARVADENSISANSKLMLANAIYFKGKWQSPFGREKTLPKCFHTEEYGCLKVPMMANSGSYEYAYIDRLDSNVIALPYEGGRYSMLIVLPKKGKKLWQLSRDMMHVSLEDVFSKLQMQEVLVEVPRFTVEYRNDLVPYLEKLMIQQVFTPRADLSGMGHSTDRKENLAVSNVFHSAKIVVDEEGSEAAAATGVQFIPLMGGTTTAFVADHPFLFYLVDRVTGAILFSGKIEVPETEPVNNQDHHPVNGQVHPPKTFGPSGSPPKMETERVEGISGNQTPMPSFLQFPYELINPRISSDDRLNPTHNGYQNFNHPRPFTGKQMKYRSKSTYHDPIVFLNRRRLPQ